MSRLVTVDIHRLATLIEAEMGPAFVEQVGLLVQEAIPKNIKNAHYTFSFGKHKGKTYAEVEVEDSGYITWLLTWQDLRESTRESLVAFRSSFAN